MRFFSSIVIFGLLAATSAAAQKVSDFVKVDSGQAVTDGFYFYLPRTALEFEFTIAETKYSKGELSNFAAQYFQTQPENMNNRSKFSIENISMKPYPVADPSQKYSYSFQTASSVNIQTVGGGIIKSINSPVDVKTEEINSYGLISKFSKNDEAADASVPFFSLGVKSDTIINREITADSTVIERRVINRRTITNTPEEMARESIQKLDDIRKVRYTLISGPEDVMMDGASLSTSLKELEKTEQELLALFFGKTKKVTQTYRITYIPGESPETMFYLSPENGVSMLLGSGFPNVKMNIKPFNVLPQNSTSNAGKNGVIPYRSSEKMVLSIQWNGSKYFETELMLPQYGQIYTVPAKSLSSIRVVYDEQSGAIESVGPAEKK